MTALKVSTIARRVLGHTYPMKCGKANGPTWSMITNRYICDDSNSDSDHFDVVVMGAGIVGCAIARQLKQSHNELRIALIDKESTLAAHQTSHNSGVLHAGLYYSPGTLKARLCQQGRQLIDEYAHKRRLPIERVGKLVVACTPQEEPILLQLFDRCRANQVPDVQLIDRRQVQLLQPSVSAVRAIWSPHTSIVDFARVAASFAADFQDLGGQVRTDCQLEKATVDPLHRSHPIELQFTHSSRSSVRTRYVITACGLQSDRVAELCGGSSEPRVVPIRGEYLVVKASQDDASVPSITCNVYPVPNPSLPFLGVHFTPRIGGQVWIGPNALFSWRREAYESPWFDAKDTWDALRFVGTRKLARDRWRYALDEWTRSRTLSAQVGRARQMVPSLRVEHVERGPVGVRAQAVDRDGRLVDDFVFDTGSGLFEKRVLHVRNAPSPAATSSMAIAHHVVHKFETENLCLL
jgi:2-hydroxyglutarate dehydrogenase